jgi:hypothetical protein
MDNPSDRDDANLLHKAVKEQDIEKVKDLLSKAKADAISLDINAEDANGITALIEACVVGNETLVHLLLQAGCPAQPKPPYRHAPLRGACVAGQAHLIPILLQAGADPNAPSDGHRTPLMGACFLRRTAPNEKSALCTKALLKDPRTDPTIRNSFGETALDLAAVRNYEETIAMVEEALQDARWLPPGYIPAGIPYWSSGDRRRQPLPSTEKNTNCFVFQDFPDFRPNVSPDQVLQAGSFGGTYFRSIASKTAAKTFPEGVHLEFPSKWFQGWSNNNNNNVERMVTSLTYQKQVNKYKVKSGNDLEFWEHKGWMRTQDPYGWFQWYCRFFLGRRTHDDERQVSRWVKAIGIKGRWRTFLVGQCVKANKAWDDVSASPVTRQTLLHWGYELTQADYAAIAPAIQKGKSVIYMGVVVANAQQPEESEDATNHLRRSKRQKTAS